MNTSLPPYGVVDHESMDRVDHLFRLSLKVLLFNERNEVLLVKESGRDDWDIPGGGMEHGESLKDALTRELKEEVNLQGDFTYQVISMEDPRLVESIRIWQARAIFAVWPENVEFSAGDDGDEIRFATIDELKESRIPEEQMYGTYAEKALTLRP